MPARKTPKAAGHNLVDEENVRLRAQIAQQDAEMQKLTRSQQPYMCKPGLPHFPPGPSRGGAPTEAVASKAVASKAAASKAAVSWAVATHPLTATSRSKPTTKQPLAHRAPTCPGAASTVKRASS